MGTDRKWRCCGNELVGPGLVFGTENTGPRLLGRSRANHNVAVHFAGPNDCQANDAEIVEVEHLLSRVLNKSTGIFDRGNDDRRN